MSATTIVRGGSLGSIEREEAYRWLYANLIDLLEDAAWINDTNTKGRINALTLECMQLVRGLEQDDATCSYASLMEERAKQRASREDAEVST